MTKGLLIPLFYRPPPEISREILRFLDPIKKAQEARIEWIKKNGPMRVNWCMKCGEYATRRLIDWIVLTDTEGNTYYLYVCPHCRKENVVKIAHRG